VSCADDLRANDGLLADKVYSSNKVPSQRALFLVVHTRDDFDAAVEQIVLLSDRHPGARIAIMTDHYRIDELVSSFRAGASGYFVDVMKCSVFVKSIELLMMGETIFSPTFRPSALDCEEDHTGEPAPGNKKDGKENAVAAEGTIVPQLSQREKSILRCLIQGDSNKCIARKTDIAEATVRVHVKAILRKTRVRNRTQAAIWAMNNESLGQTANTESPPLAPSLSKRQQSAASPISDVKQQIHLSRQA
jgi:two-component system nitrate/nitrite response regulator NarL